MSKKEKFLILAIFLSMVILILIIMAGITGTAESLEKIKTVKGTVHYIINPECGFWGIISDDGKRYEPIHLSRELQRPGLKAEFTLIIFEGHVSIRMWGIVVEILDYKISH